MKTIKELIALLTLEELEAHIFLDQNYQAPWGRVFWGSSTCTIITCGL